MRSQPDLGEFLESEVYPALFERLDTAFPEFGWRPSGRGWTATDREHTKGLPGAPRPERVVCHAPFGFLVYGHGPTNWTAYVNGGEPPTGRAFVEAVRKLAELAGVPFPERELTPAEAQAHERRERGQALLETFLAKAQEALCGEEGLAAVDYLTHRGFQGNLDELTGCGFGLYTTRPEIEAQLVAAGFTTEEVQHSGLLRDGRWEGRLVLPWRDRWGRVATVAARDLTGTADEGAKYLYLAEHHKPTAFGLDVALRPDAGGREHLILVEGLLDVVALQRHGLRNVAALGGDGRQLTAERWGALAGFGVKRATLVLDNDTAGREGTKAALDHALRAEAVPEVWVVDPAALGMAKDPDELLRREGREAVQALLDRRTSGNVYLGCRLVEGVTPQSPDHERRAAVDHFLELDRQLHGPRVELDREDVLRLLEEHTGYSLETLAAQAESHRDRRRREEAERALRRTLREAQDGLAGGEDVTAVANTLSAELAALRAQTVEPPPAFSVDRLLEASKRLPAGKASGWLDLDRLEVPFCAGELTLLGARTGHAKTAFAVNLVAHWLPDAEDELLVFYSAEEPEVAVFRRLLSLLTAGDEDGRWTATEIRARLQGAEPPNGRDWPPLNTLQDAQERLRSWEDRLLVVHEPSWSVDQLVAHAVDLGRRRPVGAVVVDYLQRVYPPAGRFDRRDLEVSAVARHLKSLAVELNAPVVAGAQIGRQAVTDAAKIPTGRYDEKKVQGAIRKRRPQLHHLREGGSEQEADLVLGLLNYRADYTEEADEEGKTAEVPDVTRLEVGSLKNRYGPVGRWASLAFEARYGLIRDPEPREEL